MKLIVLAIFTAIIATAALAADAPPIFEKPDPKSKFRAAQLHVKELMKAGQYKEASEYMTVYQRLGCEAAEQKAGTSIEEGTAICARKYHQAGVNAISAQSATDSLSSSNTLAPGIMVMPRTLPGSPTALDSGSTPSLFVFDPRSTPGQGGSAPDRKVDPWTGSH
ncbi:MAG: hypothetical protein ABI284_08925 [Nitrosospira sp.]